jgi:hypothetical protein
MYLDTRFEHPREFCRDVGALFIDPEQVRAHIEIGCVNRDVLRRKSLLDDATHFIFGD